MYRGSTLPLKCGGAGMPQHASARFRIAFAGQGTGAFSILTLAIPHRTRSIDGSGTQRWLKLSGIGSNDARSSVSARFLDLVQFFAKHLSSFRALSIPINVLDSNSVILNRFCVDGGGSARGRGYITTLSARRHRTAA